MEFLPDGGQDWRDDEQTSPAGTTHRHPKPRWPYSDNIASSAHMHRSRIWRHDSGACCRRARCRWCAALCLLEKCRHRAVCPSESRCVKMCRHRASLRRERECVERSRGQPASPGNGPFHKRYQQQADLASNQATFGSIKHSLWIRPSHRCAWALVRRRQRLRARRRGDS